MRTIFYLLVSFFILSRCEAQNTIPIRFPEEPIRNTQIGIIEKNGTLYGSLNDIVRAFKFHTRQNSEALKVDIQTPSYTVRITANNPFAIIIDAKENASIVQMSAFSLFTADAFFVPLDQFIPILKTALEQEITFDRTGIVVGRGHIASSFDITGVSFEEKSNGYLIRLQCNKKIPDYESWSKQIGDNTWLYVTLANVRADVESIKRSALTDFVKQILVFQSPTAVQLTFKLKGEISGTEPLTADNSNDILLAVHTPTVEQITERKSHDYQQTLQKERDKWKLDVVVIDAGHGGNDPGTIGVANVKEKDITLGIALKLGKLIEKNLPKVKVVYTRKTDTFIELYRRGQIANESGGKLFISIHCNAMPHKPNPMNGFEIYLLRPGKTENALRIAERENAVIKLEEGYEKRYQQLTEENFILLTMAQSAYVKYSEQFANTLQREMTQHLDVANNGVKQAGFYVLVGASMPNVLVETGYLSSKHDEKILASEKGQQRIAEAIFGGIKRYKQEYEKSLNEGKEFGLNAGE